MFTRRNRWAISPVLLILLALPPATLAQETTAAINDWAGVKSIPGGSNLEVRLKNGKTLRGKMINLSDTALSLSDHKKPTDLRLEDVLSVHRMRGMTAKKATLIGAGVGAAIGAGLGAATTGNDRCYIFCI